MIKSILKAVAILDHIAGNENQRTLTEISNGLQISITTLHGIMATLESCNLVCRNSVTGKYELGYKIVQLSSKCKSQEIIKNKVHPLLEEIAREVEETVHLTIPINDEEVLYIDKIESAKVFRMTSLVGTKSGINDSACALLLAYYNNREKFPKELEQYVFKMGDEFYCCKYEPDMDAYCIGAVIKDHRKVAIAAISIVIPEYRFSEDVRNHMISYIMEAIQRLEASF